MAEVSSGVSRARTSGRRRLHRWLRDAVINLCSWHPVHVGCLQPLFALRRASVHCVGAMWVVVCVLSSVGVSEARGAVDVT